MQIKDNTETQSKLNSLTTKKTTKSATADLQKYAGVYVLETYNISIILEIRDNKLFAKVPGQEDDEFEFQSEHIFTVRENKVIKLRSKCTGR